MHGILNPDETPRDGIVFIEANWSGQSRMLFPVLIDILKEYAAIQFYIYDIDEALYTKFAILYNVKSHGMGETYWLKNGDIVTEMNFRTFSKEQVIKNCEQQLLIEL
jgi:hypothetical protein